MFQQYFKILGGNLYWHQIQLLRDVLTGRFFPLLMLMNIHFCSEPVMFC